ncbi:nitroreductase [Mycobacterium asiaticum]|uniref:Nitroreductase n=1 Tax=Mycobacterium asiaticum TaxID=1790 RepID=A0A1A3P3U1_MYCAS|nr:nitroreductase family protein [Mycobacterium asiaticum]OBK28841.1 nitroreductase [Mycobacterium asiaticum]
MELYDAMRTAFAAREFTDDPLPDDVLYRIFDNARFAPSGGNRQGAHVTVVRDVEIRRQLAELGVLASRRYFAQLNAGEYPWNTLHPSQVPQSVIDATDVPEAFIAPIAKAPVVLVVSVDLGVVAAIDQDLDRVGLAAGASVYPLVWNILLAARNEGYGGTMTTMAIAREDRVRNLLRIPDTHAVAALVPLGKPTRQLTKLRRRAVSEFVTQDRFDGSVFEDGRASNRFQTAFVTPT